MTDERKPPPDILETMDAARAIIEGCGTPTDAQLRAIAYRTISLDLQVENDRKSMRDLEAALAESLDGWRGEIDDEYGETAVERRPQALARIAELRARFLGGE